MYVVQECLGTKVNRLDKGLHVGEETDPCTEILGGLGCGFASANELFQFEDAALHWQGVSN